LHIEVWNTDTTSLSFYELCEHNPSISARKPNTINKAAQHNPSISARKPNTINKNNISELPQLQ
jgi:hypothetical protein